MADMQKEIIMELFLECDSVTSINRSIAAIGSVVQEHCENTIQYDEALAGEYLEKLCETSQDNKATFQRNTDLYDTINEYTDGEYEGRFKMKRGTCQALIIFLKEYMFNMNEDVLTRKVHIFLWVMTSGASFNDVAELFGVHKSSVAFTFHEIATVLMNQQYTFISWPSIEEQHATSFKVHNCFKFPNCVGFMDTLSLKVGSKNSMNVQPEIVLLQAVCDDSLSFMDIFIGPVGKTSKAEIFKDSPLYHKLCNFIDFNFHILGDTNYSLQRNLIVPYNDEELYSFKERKFNDVHRNARMYIKHAFDVLKDNFRKLNHIDLQMESIEQLISAACVLHNFIIFHEGSITIKAEHSNQDEAVSIDCSELRSALEKREFLCDFINYGLPT